MQGGEDGTAPVPPVGDVNNQEAYNLSGEVWQGCWLEQPMTCHGFAVERLFQKIFAWLWKRLTHQL